MGGSPLWVARQHGHSIATMLRAYAAWTEGAVEADIEAIRRAMQTQPRAVRRQMGPAPKRQDEMNSAAKTTQPSVAPGTDDPETSFASGFASSAHRQDAKCSKKMGKRWRRESPNSTLRRLSPLASCVLPRAAISPESPDLNTLSAALGDLLPYRHWPRGIRGVCTRASMPTNRIRSTAALASMVSVGVELHPARLPFMIA
jgi:hypothetical protein